MVLTFSPCPRERASANRGAVSVVFNNLWLDLRKGLGIGVNLGEIGVELASTILTEPTRYEGIH